MRKYYEGLSLNYDEWIVKYSPTFEANIKSYPKRILTSLYREIERLRKNPDIGKNLGSQRPWIYEIHVDIRYRLYYEIWEKKRIIYLKAFYPKNKQKSFLEGRIP